MRLKVSKLIISILLLSIPLNFIVIEGIGNIYLSMVIILIGALLLFLSSEGEILSRKNSLYVLTAFIITLLVTTINVIFYNFDLIRFQFISTIIYFQVTLVFVTVSFYYRSISLSYLYRLFIIISLFSLIRVIIEEPNHIFKLSILWEERIESTFIGGVNNFALILGIAFIISFFYIKDKWLKRILCVTFLSFIVLTMSRGGLFAVILTLFITSLYDTDRSTFKLLVKYSLYIFLTGFTFLLIIGKIDLVVEKIQSRFFSLFTEKIDVNTFFSSRGDLFSDIFKKLSDSSIFQIMFGHGNGSIDFYNVASGIYFETSHNILIDILYKNGVLFLLTYILVISYLFFLFIKKRHREKLPLFGVFIFIHLELLVNPIVFAAQVGWLYSIFMVYFLQQNKVINYIKN